MDSKKYDVVVVGGGPVGVVAAREAAENGAKVLVIEEHTRVGKPVKCTGLISLRCFEGVGINEEVVLREVKGGFLHAPNGQRLCIEAKGPKILVIDRASFDQALLEKTKKVDAHVETGVKAIGQSGNTLTLVDNGYKRTVQAKVIIGADGPCSRIAKWAGLPSLKKMLFGLQVILPYKPEREDFLEVFFGKEIAPNFFGWAVPAEEGLARIGLATDDGKKMRSCLQRLLTRFSGTILEYNVGLIPLGTRARTVADGVMVVGDAAGQVKPTSGGGLYTGITCAKMAGEVAAKCALNGDTSKEALSEYEQRWRSLLERELYFGMLAHKLLCYLSDKDLNRIFKIMDDPEILEAIADYGDVDYPSILAREFIKRPRFWGRLLNLLPSNGIVTGILDFFKPSKPV